MKALILNSGVGSRMGEYTRQVPKCMVRLIKEQTILERQLRMLCREGIKEAVITTGFMADRLKQHAASLGLPIRLCFVNNDRYDMTNYIYSMYLAKSDLQDDIILLHGDLVFEQRVLEDMIKCGKSCMAVSTFCALPKKDFKAVLQNGRIVRIGIEFFENAVAAQPLYVLRRELWMKWMKKIGEFYQKGELACYAENALNQILNKEILYPYDYGNRLCQEVDKEEDLLEVRKAIGNLE